LDLTTKVQILNYLAKGKKQIEAARRFGVARGTVTEIFRRRFELLERFGRCKNGKAKSTKESPFQPIEDPLIQWINDARKNNIPLNLTLVAEKALEIAKDVGLERFSASPGWMYRFRKRNSFGPNFDQERRFKYSMMMKKMLMTTITWKKKTTTIPFPLNREIST